MFIISYFTVNQSGVVGEENHTTTGIIVIAVVICIVGTSIVWVVIIYHTRKRTEDYASPASSSAPHTDMVPYSTCSGVCPKDLKKPSGRHALMDTYSGMCFTLEKCCIILCLLQ